jgi:hypothetical protein
MKKILIFLSILASMICVSCLSEKQKNARANQLALDKIESIDMTSIDHFPVFKACDEMLTTPDCFYEELHKVIDCKLRTPSIPIKLSRKDSLYASITVSKTGVIQYDSIYKCATGIDREQTHELFKNRLKDFPTVESARKMSIPITTTYKLPIIFSPVDSLAH